MCCLAVLQALGPGSFNLFFFLLTCSIFFLFLSKQRIPDFYPVFEPSMHSTLTGQGHIMPQSTDCQASHTEGKALLSTAGWTGE